MDAMPSGTHPAALPEAHPTALPETHPTTLPERYPAMSLEVGIMGSSNSSGHPKSDLRVIIADDMLPIREYLKMVLSHEPDMHILAAVGTAADAVKISLAEQPDVVLMDLEMETQRAGVDAIGELAQKAPSVRCVVLTHFGDDDTVFAVRGGCGRLHTEERISRRDHPGRAGSCGGQVADPAAGGQNDTLRVPLHEDRAEATRVDSQHSVDSLRPNWQS